MTRSALIGQMGFWALVLLGLGTWTPASTDAQVRSVNDGGCAWADEDAGTLYVRAAKGDWIEAPTMHISFDLNITGLIARTQVTHTMSNPTDETVEAVYVYPLPEDAAVDGLRIEAGGRVIEGEIQERAQAQRTYERAKALGRRAGLVKQVHTSMFSTRISHILPGEQVKVVLQLQHEVHYEAGQFSLTLPTTITPRYVTGSNTVQGFSETGFSAPPVQVPDTAPISTPITTSNGPTFEAHIHLARGLELDTIESPSHAITARETGSGHEITLKHNKASADREFRLRWAPAIEVAPTAALYIDDFHNERYAMLMVLPSIADNAPQLKREVTFIIDRSGSMGGTSMEQARVALHRGLMSLHQGDTFNVIAFDDQVDTLYGAPQLTTAARLEEAHHFADALDARGGTEMADALTAAFAAPQDSERVQQVVFVTDGAVGNEQTLLHLIHTQLGERRLFPVAIGSAPNRGFMREAARFGRGTMSMIANVSEVKERMSSLIEKLTSPMLRDLRIDGSSTDAFELYPTRLPDLYRGEPLMVSVRLPDHAAGSANSTQTFTISGQLAEQPWSMTFPLQGGARQPGVSKAWARRAIDHWLDQKTIGTGADTVRTEVLGVALTFGMVSPYTALVAVDKGAPIADGRAATTRAIPNQAPAGSDMLGNMPQTASPAPLMLLLALLCLLVATGIGRFA